MANNTPTHRAYTVRERDGADPFWTRIGSAFPHRDGKGLNVILDAVPTDGRVVLREIDAEEETEEEPKRKTTRSTKKRAA